MVRPRRPLSTSNATRMPSSSYHERWWSTHSALHTGGLRQETAIAIGASIGGAVLIVMVVLLFKVFSKRREYHRTVAEIEGGLQTSHDRSLGRAAIPRPLSSARTSSIPSSYRPLAGWKVLSSSETVHKIFHGEPVEKDCSRVDFPGRLPGPIIVG